MPRQRATVSSNGDKPNTTAQWIAYIRDSWDKTAASFIETGKRLLEAKEKVQHGEWRGMFRQGRLDTREGILPFSDRIGQMLMEIARNPVLTNPKFISVLPPAYTTLYALAGLPESELKTLLEDGNVHVETQCSQVKSFGFYHIDQAYKALHVLLQFIGRMEPAKLAEHWRPNAPYHMHDSYQLAELRCLPNYLTQLCEEIWKRYEQTSACMDGWKEGGVDAVHENARIAEMKKQANRRAAKTKTAKLNGNEHHPNG